MVDSKITSYGGLYIGKALGNHSYSSGPFIKLTATKEGLEIKGLFTKLKLEKKRDYFNKQL